MVQRRTIVDEQHHSGSEVVVTSAQAVAQRRRALGHELLKQYGIRVGQITHCSVCHR